MVAGHFTHLAHWIVGGSPCFCGTGGFLPHVLCVVLGSDNSLHVERLLVQKRESEMASLEWCWDAIYG